MRNQRKSAWCSAIERALLARDRREIASVERLLRALKIEVRQHKALTRHRRGR
jgi:hypothetical protein